MALKVVVIKNNSAAAYEVVEVVNHNFLKKRLMPSGEIFSSFRTRCNRSSSITPLYSQYAKHFAEKSLIPLQGYLVSSHSVPECGQFYGYIVVYHIKQVSSIVKVNPNFSAAFSHIRIQV